MKPRKWGGRKAQAWTKAVLREHGTVCALRLEGCTLLATTGDHIKPRSLYPWLQYDVTNGRPACQHCNSSRGARPLRGRVIVDARTFFETAANSVEGNPLVSPPGGQKDGRP